MSSRDIRARLDRLAKALGEQKTDGPVCRFHGLRCRMGANWPLDYQEDPADELLDLFADARRSLGLEVAPHPRDRWRTDRHEQVPPEELARNKQEADELLTAVKARNDQLEAALRAEPAVINHQEES
ncbi:hypothetical protein [Streptomyces sp. NBC_01092]|uniref:hypothetical protein n=1 Tax=Streptomyces sp. NBC_01092 TaxID=2903748 RepID=UPI00386CC6D4|nr:hypothetical protein OG254_12480 [Streptomyces sp. NBC_01092]WSU51255.1 hypothetical protein OG254_24255 [Streptomyces sp. NBC_01092]